MKIPFYSTLALILGSLPVAAQSSPDITGTVFADTDCNGVKATTEPALGGVTVCAYSSTGALVHQVTTATNGTYGIISGGTFPLRIEFKPPVGYVSSVFSAASGGAVQFVAAASSAVHAGFLLPASYCEANPLMTTPCYVAGNPLGGGNAGTADVLVSLNYLSSGFTPAMQHTAVGSQMGAVWGIAWDSVRKRVYASTVLRRHSGFGPFNLSANGGDNSNAGTENGAIPNPAGVSGSGGIYLVDFITGTSSVSNYVNLQSLGIDTGNFTVARGLPASKTDPSHDTESFERVAKMGIGDVDMDETGNYLWAVNLKNRSLVKMDVSGASAPTSATEFTLSGMSGWPADDANGIQRPWALAFRYGKGYVGVVNDASLSNDYHHLVARVLSFNPANPTALTTEITVPLDYVKGFNNNTVAGTNQWWPWYNVYTDAMIHHSSPILSDIEFDATGSMMLGFMDRSGLQLGSQNYRPDPLDTGLILHQTGGDILRATPNGSGVYVLESNGSVGGFTTAGAGNNQGPGGGEYYWRDNLTGQSHEELIFGGLAQVPWDNSISITAMDPIDTTGNDLFFNTYWSGGIIYLHNQTGNRTRSARIYAPALIFDQTTGAYLGVSGAAGKSVGLGDIEALCGLNQPIEIGNRVWLDSDADGVQDAGEAGIAGIVVELVNSSNAVIASAFTDASGNYYFTNVAGTSTASFIRGITGLTANASYTVRIPNTSGVNKQNLLGSTTLTTANSDGTANGDERDSDGSTSGTSAVVTVSTIGAACGNHSLDFGFANGVLGTNTDYGDLSDSGTGTGTGNYETLLASNGPRHTIVTGYRIGATIDGDNGLLQNGTAAADDAQDSGSADDEDGVDTFPVFSAGGSGTITVSITNPVGGTGAGNLYGFYDWNGDGDFADTNEASSVAVPDGATSVNLPYTVPFGGVTGVNIGLRLRLTTTALTVGAAGSVGAAANGEVEDYLVQVQPVDLGDLPDTTAAVGAGNYQTLGANNGARHSIVADFRIGASIDSDSGTAQNATATADDTTGTTDDEDGVASFPTFIRGERGNINVAITNLTGGVGAATLYGFIDWNNDGDFDDASEVTTVAVPDGITGVVLPYTVPTTAATAANLGLRLRLTTDALTMNQAGSLGAASNGEVEDYIISVQRMDFGDLADVEAGTGAGEYQTLSANNGPRHQIVTGLNIGALNSVDEDSGALQNGAASLDDTTNTGLADDEDGVAAFPTFIRGTSGTVTIAISNPAGGIGTATLYGYIDWNGDGDFNDTNEVTSIAVADAATSVNLPYTIPADAVLGTNLGFRLRLRSTTRPAPRMTKTVWRASRPSCAAKAARCPWRSTTRSAASKVQRSMVSLTGTTTVTLAMRMK